MTNKRELINRIIGDLTSGLKLFGVLFVIFLLLQNLMTNDLTIEPFEVPLGFKNSGITGELLLTLTMDKYKEITEEVYKGEQFTALIDPDLDITSSIEKASDLGGAINSIFNIIRKQIGYEPNEVNIKVAEFPASYQVFIKIPQEKIRQVTVPKDSTKSLNEHLQEMSNKIAYEFIINQKPNALMGYLSLNPGINLRIADFETYAQRALLVEGANTGEIYFFWYQFFNAKGQTARGTELLLEGYAQDSTNLELLHGLIFSYGNDHQYEKALFFAKRALEIDATFGKIYLPIAFVQIGQGKYEAALKSIEKFYTFFDGSEVRRKANTYNVKANIYARQMNYDSTAHYAALLMETAKVPTFEAEIWMHYAAAIEDVNLLIQQFEIMNQNGHIPTAKEFSQPFFSKMLTYPKVRAFLEKNGVEMGQNLSKH